MKAIFDYFTQADTPEIIIGVLAIGSIYLLVSTLLKRNSNDDNDNNSSISFLLSRHKETNKPMPVKKLAALPINNKNAFMIFWIKIRLKNTGEVAPARLSFLRSFFRNNRVHSCRCIV